LPEREEVRRAQWERKITPLLAEADSCPGPCQEACRLWARFVRGAGSERIALAPSR